MGLNWFVCPHGKVDEADTNFKYYTPKRVFELNFSPQNVMPSQVHYIPGPVSPPRMDLSYEEEIPVLFSPLTDHENDSTDENEEYFEPDLLPNEKHEDNLSGQPQEYVEPDYPENENYSTSAVNGIMLSTANCQDIDSESSWDELMRLEEELDDISDTEDPRLKMEDGECSPSPPRKLPKKPKIPKRLKNRQLTKSLKTYPIMYSKVIASNFLYHSTRYIKIPVNVPKISGIPNFYSLPNVKISTDNQFLTAFSQTSVLSTSNYSSDTMHQLKNLRTKIPPILFSANHQATPTIHYNFLCKPNSLSLITQQELRLPNVIWTGCEKKSLNCLDCKYLKTETSPVD